MRKIRMLILFVICAIFSVGCGDNRKGENAIKEDLINNQYFYIAEGSEVVDFSVIKRLTENNTDTVYVSVSLDNENFTEERFYEMNYLKYDEGWFLEAVFTYSGMGWEWSVEPKNAPSQEVIIDSLISYSYNALAEYGTSYLFFDYPNYTCTVENESADFVNRIYTCDVVTDRVFKFVDVTEKNHLTFYFQEFELGNYGWVCSEKVITDVTADWHLKSKWTKDFEYNNGRKVVTAVLNIEEDGTAHVEVDGEEMRVIDDISVPIVCSEQIELEEFKYYTANRYATAQTSYFGPDGLHGWTYIGE